jgi:hypothetical protein
LNLVPQIERAEIPALKHRFADLSQFRWLAIRWALYVFAREAVQDVFGLCCAGSQGGTVFDHLIILLAHESQ